MLLSDSEDRKCDENSRESISGKSLSFKIYLPDEEKLNEESHVMGVLLSFSDFWVL
jgi:hypothetical protein